MEPATIECERLKTTRTWVCALDGRFLWKFYSVSLYRCERRRKERKTRIHAVLSSPLFSFCTHVMCVELVCFETFLVIGIQFSCFFPCRLFVWQSFFRCRSLCSFRVHVLLKCFWDFKIYFILSVYSLKYCLWAICARSLHSVALYSPSPFSYTFPLSLRVTRQKNYLLILSYMLFTCLNLVPPLLASTAF